MRSRRFLCSSSSVSIDPLDSIVKVFSNNCPPNYKLPWQNKAQRDVTGSAFVLSTNPGLILTNAHVIAHNQLIFVRRHGISSKYEAEVKAVSHESDLALLSVPDLSFFDNLYPLPLDPSPTPEDIPELDSEVAVVGFPTGGDNISLTRGVVSRIEPQRYAHSGAEILAIQIDAAINPGNSGGPALQGDTVVGIAFQNLSGAENIGFIIPVPIIKHFLTTYEHNDKPRGFGSIGMNLQSIENPQLRSFLGIPGTKDSGMRISEVDPLSDAVGKVLPDDVLMEIDEIPVASDGTILFRDKSRISFRYYLMQKFIGDSVNLTLWRPSIKDTVKASVKLISSIENNLAPFHFDTSPSYHIWAGFVFVNLSVPYLYDHGEDWYSQVPRKLIDLAFEQPKSEKNEQVVLISQMLVHKVNTGYGNLTNLRVISVNGERILNLRHLKKCIQETPGEFVKIALDEGFIIAIRKEDAQRAEMDILQRHRVASVSSHDL